MALFIGAAYAEPEADIDIDVNENTAAGTQSGQSEGFIGIQPLTTGTDGSSFVMNVADSGGAWKEVDSIGNAMTWPFLAAGTRQVQFVVGFPVGTEQDRKLDIVIPGGYRILEMSASHTWPVPSGITKLSLSDEDNSKVASTVLTASDGSAWPKAIPMGSIMSSAGNYYSPAVSGQTLRDGKITYTLNSNCDTITLTLTLGLDQSIMPHNQASVSLNPLTATMTSGEVTIPKTLNTTVTDIELPRINPAMGSNIFGGSRTIAGTPDAVDTTKGTVPEFATGFGYSCYNVATGTQNHWAESATLSVTYPIGATFKGFQDYPVFNSTNALAGNIKYVDADFTTSGGLDVYEISSGNAAGHLKVTHNPAIRTVTFEYKNAFFRHSGNDFYLYWEADINQNGSSFLWDEKVSFNATFTETGGVFINNTQTLTPINASVEITVKKPVDFDVRATATSRTRHDWNAYADGAYPYDYMLGQFRVYNAAPNAFTGTLVYEFGFDDSLHVRGLSLPGFTGNDFYGVKATTNQRVIDLPGPFYAANTSTNASGFAFDSAVLGLGPNEYLKAFYVEQSGLVAETFTNNYIFSPVSYFGRWQNGTPGYATVEVYDKADRTNHSTGVVTGRTTIGWDQAGAGIATMSYRNKNGVLNSTGSFNPNDTINFQAALTTGVSVLQSNDICDPKVYISLPAGIDLDIGSVLGMSASGNHGDSWFDLRLASTDSLTDSGGVIWNTYGFESANKLDMVAKADYGLDASLQPAGYNNMNVRFSAVVSSACQTYTGLAARDLVVWDLGKSAVNATAGASYVFADGNEIAGEGSSYNITGASYSIPLNIVQKQGLNVTLGIRVAGDNVPFFTYSGLDSTIAGVAVDLPAELQVAYENTSTSAFKAGSEIYLPIPKEGREYDRYFNNTEISDPLNIENNIAPGWSAYLTGPVSMGDFDTFYLIEDAYRTTFIPTGGIDESWKPIAPSATWIPASGTSGWTSDDWKEVKMIKFVANADIPVDAKGSTTFEINVDPDAKIGQTNYWRSYQKGWRDDDGKGTWQYGAVVAAQPGKAGITGMIFFDKQERNGFKDTGEDFDPTGTGDPGGIVTAMLSGSTITPLNLTITNDGRVRSLITDGSLYYQYFLKAGTYTVTFTNNTAGAYFFTDVTPATRSSGTEWYMDIEQADISGNTATYTFEVIETSSTSTEYIGLGMRTAEYSLTYDLNEPAGTAIASFGSSGVASQAGIPYGTIVSSTASYIANTSAAGKPTLSKHHFDGWYSDSECITPATQTAVTANKTVYAKWAPGLTVIYISNTGTGSVPVDNTPYYNGERATVLHPYNLSKANHSFAGWNTLADDSGDFYAPGSEITVTTHMILYAIWDEHPAYTLSYDGNGHTGGAPPTHTNGNAPAGGNNFYTGTSVALMGPAFMTMTGYTFLGWAGSADAAAATYKAGNSFTILGDTTLYAVWGVNAPYVVTPPPVDPPPVNPPPVNPPPVNPPPVNPPPVNPPVEPPVSTSGTETPVTYVEIGESPAVIDSPIEDHINAGVPVFTIGGEHFVLYALEGYKAWSLVSFLLCIAGAIVALAAVNRMTKLRREEREERLEANSIEPKGRRPIWLAVACTMCVLGFAVFLPTVYTGGIMVLVDYGTLINALMFAELVLTARLAFKKEREKSEYFVSLKPVSTTA